MVNGAGRVYYSIISFPQLGARLTPCPARQTRVTLPAPQRQVLATSGLLLVGTFGRKGAMAKGPGVGGMELLNRSQVVQDKVDATEREPF